MESGLWLEATSLLLLVVGYLKFFVLNDYPVFRLGRLGPFIFSPKGVAPKLPKCADGELNLR
jgi:hypothetical protein